MKRKNLNVTAGPVYERTKIACPTEDRKVQSLLNAITILFAIIRDFAPHCATFFQKPWDRAEKQALTIIRSTIYAVPLASGTRVGHPNRKNLGKGERRSFSEVGPLW